MSKTRTAAKGRILAHLREMDRGLVIEQRMFLLGYLTIAPECVVIAMFKLLMAGVSGVDEE